MLNAGLSNALRTGGVFALLLVVLAGCDFVNKEPAVLNGMVMNNANGRGVAAAVVQLTTVRDGRVLQEMRTDEEGTYSFVIDVDSVEVFNVIAFKQGEFEPGQQQVTVLAEQVLTLPDFRLVPMVGETRPATLAGVVVDDRTGVPLAGARVQLEDVAQRRVLNAVTTGGDGAFELAIALSEDRPLRVTASREGFESHHVDLDVEASQAYALGDLRLAPVVAAVRSITLAERTAEAIGVSGSGTTETVTLTFKVLDGNGQPLNSASSVPVNFEMLERPSIGQEPESEGVEFVYPAQINTDENGFASVTLTSGYKAGAVQIQASAPGLNGTVRSQPVIITIHGGFAVTGRFTVAPERLNFHGRVTAGITNTINVIAGDEHGNPVAPQTKIYFTTNSGVIEGSSTTDSQGRASAQLIAGQPLPSNGLASITARAAGRGGVLVQASTDVLFSGRTEVRLELIGGSLSSAGGLQYRYTVSDDLGNPIVGGSTASVAIEGENVKLIGQSSVTIPDALAGGRNITVFEFSVLRDNPTGGGTTLESITIDVTSPNGSPSVTCIGSACTQQGAIALRQPR